MRYLDAILQQSKIVADAGQGVSTDDSRCSVHGGTANAINTGAMFKDRKASTSLVLLRVTRENS